MYIGRKRIESDTFMDEQVRSLNILKVTALRTIPEILFIAVTFTFDVIHVL